MIRKILPFLLLLNCAIADELAIVALFKNEAPYLDEWITYHRLVGVDHFYLYNNESTDDFERILEPYVKKGIVEVFDWPSDPTHDTHIPAQIAAYKDGLKRAKETTWVALIDLDEYLVPKQHKTIVECLKEHFSDADAVYVTWRNFGTSFMEVPKHEAILNKLTLSSQAYHGTNSIGKSILRPTKVLIQEIWYVHHCPMISGAKYYDGNHTFLAEGNYNLENLQHASDLMVLHHYGHRDEQYFHQIRIKRYLQRFKSIDILLQHYQEFNETPNFDLINYLKKYHPDSYRRYWDKSIPKAGS